MVLLKLFGEEMKPKIYPLVLLSIILSSTAGASGRYFYEGDGTLSIKKNKSGALITAHYRNENGTYNAPEQAKIDQMFGMPSKNLGENTSLRLVSFLDYLQDRFTPSKPLTLLSGYRSPEYNNRLREKGRTAAQTSYHLDGMATDVIFASGQHQKIWDFVRQLDNFGIGIYSGHSLHIDSGRPRFWTQETALPKSKEPLENKNIYLSVEYDIYKPGEVIRMFLSGISDFPFGVRPTFGLVTQKHGTPLMQFIPSFGRASLRNEIPECVMINKRNDARFIYWHIPENKKWPKQKLAVRIQFCNSNQYKSMPDKITSRGFVVR
ncbi:MAG TPA: hypothetical protein DDW49_00370 [Deltaproteobacteria bacterium]|nr:MAG: hypothetical protein A2048_00365 [Deltaproteobacteria bacterium GWA2_45_12]HBF11840.1 hypothetical protein [Deltaproteobacteria bacterium]